MKKGKFLILGMLALGLVLSGCSSNSSDGDEPYDGPKTIKITGCSPSITVEYIYIFTDAATSWPPIARYGTVTIDGQTTTLTLVNNGNKEPWTGTGKFFIMIECKPPKNDQSKDGSAYVYSLDGNNPTSVDIKYEVTTLEWSKFIWVRDYTAG